EARVEVAQHDLVDVARLDTGIGQGPVGDPHDQTFHSLAVEPAEGRMRPAHDAARHDRLQLPKFGRFPLRFTTAEAGSTIKVPSLDKSCGQIRQQAAFPSSLAMV